MSNTPLKIVIKGNPVTKKNHGRIIKVNGRPIMLPSKPFIEYEKYCKQFMPVLETSIDYPVNIKCSFYMETKRKCDIVNLLQAIDDILVKYKIIYDDNYTIVASHDGTKVFYDKQNPRCEIEITKL